MTQRPLLFRVVSQSVTEAMKVLLGSVSAETQLSTPPSKPPRRSGTVTVLFMASQLREHTLFPRSFTFVMYSRKPNAKSLERIGTSRSDDAVLSFWSGLVARRWMQVIPSMVTTSSESWHSSLSLAPV